MRRRGSEQRGFALISVILLSALAAVGAAMLLDVVQLDILLGKSQRQAQEAREIAEGAVMEVINDAETPEQLPSLDDADLRAPYAAAANSAFSDGTSRGFDVDLALLRIVPLAESSALHSRAIVYEIAATGGAGRGDAHFDVRTEVYRVVAHRPGAVLPRRHAR